MPTDCSRLVSATFHSYIFQSCFAGQHMRTDVMNVTVSAEMPDVTNVKIRWQTLQFINSSEDFYQVRGPVEWVFIESGPSKASLKDLHEVKNKPRTNLHQSGILLHYLSMQRMDKNI